MIPPSDPAADPWRSHPARIVRITEEIAGVRSYDLVLGDPAVRAAYRFVPGQFNMLYLPGIGEAAISISSSIATPDLLTHTVRSVGNVTAALARAQVGDPVLIRGPFGTPWPVDRLTDRDVVIVAGGLGLASQRSLIDALARHATACRSAAVIHGAKRLADLLFQSEYAVWKAAGIDVKPIVDAGDDGWSGPVGLVTDLLDTLPLDPHRTTLLCCGPDRMMTAVAERAFERGVPAAEVYLSLERNMSCAVAHCGLCQFGPLFVCRDGPVFPFDRIARFLAVPQC
jgi:NAD(P)H-flavin reductase